MNEEQLLAKAVLWLKEGKIVAYKTETCWGLGVRADSEKAVELLRKVKGKKNEPVSILVAKPSWLNRVTSNITKYEKLLVDTYWPGPLTLVVKPDSDCPFKHITNNTIGVRCSSNKLATLLVSQFGIPITSTSANISGSALLNTANEIKEAFPDHLVKVIDYDNTENQLTESTVIEMLENKPKVYREGVISKREIITLLSTIK